MLAADPAASGMSDADENLFSARDILLACVCDESVHKQALDVIRNNDGML